MSDTKKCPYCAEEIKSEAIICKYCKMRLDGVETKNKKEYGNKADKKTQKQNKEDAAEDKHAHKIFWFWAITAILCLSLLNYYPVIAFLIIFFSIWIYPKDKDEKFFINRFKKFKEHRKYSGRVVASIIAFVVMALFTGVNIANHIEQKKADEYNKFEQEKIDEYNRMVSEYPVPKIEVLSSKDNQGQAKDYFLEFTVTDTEEVRVNGELVQLTDGAYSENIALDTIETQIAIYAKNKYKEDRINFILERDETDEEKQVRLAQEAELKKEKEDAEVEALRKQSELQEKKTVNMQTKKTVSDEDVYRALQSRMDKIYDNPSLTYILESDALMDDWEIKKTKEVAKLYGLTEDEVMDIYAKVFETRLKSGLSTQVKQSTESDKRSYLGIEYEKGECLRFDSGTTIGCASNSYCLLKTEWQEGAIHYLKGECQ